MHQLTASLLSVWNGQSPPQLTQEVLVQWDATKGKGGKKGRGKGRGGSQKGKEKGEGIERAVLKARAEVVAIQAKETEFEETVQFIEADDVESAGRMAGSSAKGENTGILSDGC